MNWNPSVWVASGSEYLRDVRTEFRRIVWPSQQEYVGGTVGVLVIVVFLTIVLGVIDMGLSQAMELVLR